MKTEAPQPVKYFIGALFSDRKLLDQAEQLCLEKIGRIDEHSQPFPFDVTDYYNAEMGTPIYRLFFSFESLMSPGRLSDLKIICNAIEAQLLQEGSRKVNLDIGYLDFHKMILASAKYNGHKIYLDQGIYADPTLIFENGQFHTVENTFPDFKSGQYDAVFVGFREVYKAQIRTLSMVK
ncbi:MAG: DUF4416 family protein [Candidatus Marinimicrobia bacterium]|nr:DUF4416 family protein [Candidatus Neomarinimicrobiota bacterium]